MSLVVLCNNCRHIYYDYELGSEVLVRVYNPASLEGWAAGQLPIKQVHVNVTLMIQCMPNILYE